MGTDIHAFMEMRADKDWVFYSTHEYLDRFYHLFAFLADVRNYVDIIPIFDPRGIPEDSCENIKKKFNRGYEIHSASYFTYKELLECRHATQHIKFSDGEKDVDFRKWLRESGDFKPMMERMESVANLYEPENVRLVYWFDN